MRFAFGIFNSANEGKRRIRLTGNPLALVLLLAVLLWLAFFIYSAVKFTWDSYGPYEGTVVEIRRVWIDRLTSESGDVEHLTIRTPQGRLIDKYVSLETSVMNHIHEGDYVVKQRGFGHHVQAQEEGP